MHIFTVGVRPGGHFLTFSLSELYIEVLKKVQFAQLFLL